MAMDYTSSKDRPTRIRLGLQHRKAEIALRLRWDKAPETCAALLTVLPLRDQVWHAKYANNEIYMLAPMPAVAPPREWLTVYPAPGDLIYLPLPEGIPLPNNVPASENGVLDVAYFYDRGNSLLTGPHGPLPGTVVATAEDVESVERFAATCNDIWFGGARDEMMFIEVA